MPLSHMQIELGLVRTATLLPCTTLPRKLECPHIAFILYVVVWLQFSRCQWGNESTDLGLKVHVLVIVRMNQT